MKLDEAQQIADNLVRELSPGCERIEIAGSVRRMKSDVKDLEIVCVPKIVTVQDLFGNSANVYSLLDSELQRLNLLKISGGDKYKKYMLSAGITLDLFITTPDQWGWIFTLRTGHKDFGHWLVTPRRYGGALPGYIKALDGWLTNSNGQIRTPEESDVFRCLGVEWLDPRYRSREYQGMWRLL